MPKQYFWWNQLINNLYNWSHQSTNSFFIRNLVKIFIYQLFHRHPSLHISPATVLAIFQTDWPKTSTSLLYLLWNSTWKNLVALAAAVISTTRTTPQTTMTTAITTFIQIITTNIISSIWNQTSYIAKYIIIDYYSRPHKKNFFFLI